MIPLNDWQKLNLVKMIHTLIWIFFNVVIGYLVYAVIVNRIGILAWVAMGLVVVEGIVLLLFRNTCPLTIIARKYSNSNKDNFDIFLPNWLARYNKIIYTVIFMVAVLGLILRKLA